MSIASLFIEYGLDQYSDPIGAFLEMTRDDDYYESQDSMPPLLKVRGGDDKDDIGTEGNKIDVEGTLLRSIHLADLPGLG